MPSIRRSVLGFYCGLHDQKYRTRDLILHFDLRGVAVSLHGERQDKPPKIMSVTYTLTVDTDESEQRLELLHKNVRQFGTVSNTVADVVNLTGKIRKKP